jgi:putative spermidine/putrescine transport system substrate-binding protein
MNRGAKPLAVLGAMVLVMTGCGGESSGNQPTATPSPVTSIEALKGEGQLNLVYWDGYLEDDWVKPFEDETGCIVKKKIGTTSDDMVNLMRQGDVYDGVSASGDATLRLIANGDIAPVDVSLFSEYDKVMPSLQSPAHNTVDGVHYGVPYMWGPNLLLYNSFLVTPAPDSWSVVFETDSPYAGKITAYDSPIYIADAALYLKSARPELGIDDPYELTQDQFDAAVELLKGQASMIPKYWAYVTDEEKGFNSGDMVIGTAWPVNQQYIAADGKVPVESVIPSEGVTGWADTWMMSANAQHPNCMLKWMDYSLRPDVQTQVAEFYGATPSNTGSCAQLEKDLGFDAAAPYHCGDDAFLSTIALWKTPLPDCGDGSECVGYEDWTTKWLEITAA